MNELVLVKQAEFEGVALDCYVQPEQTDKSDFWATRTQIGQLLGYSEPMKAVAKIHERNKERLDKFSTIVNLTTLEGGREVTREVTVYDFKGLLEICRYSNQPKADAIMDWLGRDEELWQHIVSTFALDEWFTASALQQTLPRNTLCARQVRRYLASFVAKKMLCRRGNFKSSEYIRNPRS